MPLFKANVIPATPALPLETSPLTLKAVGKGVGVGVGGGGGGGGVGVGVGGGGGGGAATGFERSTAFTVDATGSTATRLLLNELRKNARCSVSKTAGLVVTALIGNFRLLGI
jgi:hypothetical protein